MSPHKSPQEKRKAKRVREAIFCFLFALIIAIEILPGAKHSQSPVLYVVLLGGLFVGFPIAMGIGILTGHLRVRGE